MDISEASTAITTAFPALSINTISPFGVGWANITWLVNGEFVFRFPKNARVAEATLREIRVLPALRSTLPTTVPDFRYAAPHGADVYPFAFAGYTLVPGIPLKEAPRGLDLTTPAGAMGAFLSALHRYPVSLATALGVPGGTAEDWRTEYADWHEETRRLGAPYLTVNEQAVVDAIMERFLQDDRHFAFTPVLLHRDLGEEHVLIDPRTCLLSGVIDFEDMSIGDPAFDFIGLTALGPGVAAAYQGPVDGGFGERMRFYT
ncbi:MAG: phosphotransferase family protein, partial [Chloroflexota bacterium]